MPDSAEKHPPADSEEKVAELAELFLDMLRRGESVSVEDFAALHEDCSADLRELLPALVAMEGLGQSTRPTSAATAAFPEFLGGYRLLERIGSGGMGTVFRAMQESLHREVAVKILSPSWNADSRHCEAFENESRVIAGLRHTNIVEVFGAGQEGDYRYYVMSLVHGQGVTPSCIRKAFPGLPMEEAIARVGLQAADALAYAHSCGVLHRDVKPGNLLLSGDGVLSVGDFGLATVLNNGEAAPLVTQSHDGTLRYMAPERLMQGINSFAGDQYSLGVTLYELLTNRPAFRESEPGTLIHRICHHPLPPLKNEGELGAIINKSISYAPEERYVSMAAMAEDLRRYLRGIPVQARPASQLRRYSMWVRRHPALALWSHAAVLLVLLLWASISVGYVKVHRSLVSENEQRLLAEHNARIAESSLRRIFDSMINRHGEGHSLWQPTQADVRLLQELMPYYEAISAQAEEGDDKMASASRTLATIALRSGDAVTAESYFSRALELLEADSLDAARVINGLAMALLMQDDASKRTRAQELLLDFMSRADKQEPFELRLERVLALRMLGQGNIWMQHRLPAPKHPKKRAGQQERRQSLEQAAKLMRSLLEENPAHRQARHMYVDMLLRVPYGSVRRMLLPEGGSAQELVEQYLREEPNDAVFRRAYVELSLAPQQPRSRRNASESLEQFRQAASYARELLADSPGNSELLMLYIASRDRYTSALSRYGYEEDAALENEQTLGVLALLTSRADFTPEMRERLALLVAMHPHAEQDRSQQEAEIRLLLQSMDEQRLLELRDRMREMRERRARFHRNRRNHQQHSGESALKN